MRLLLLLFIFSFPLFALSNNYKVVIEEHSKKGEARKAYENYLSDSSSLISKKSHNEKFIIHFRKSGGRYIISAEPFANRQEGEAFVSQIRSKHPKAFVSQGIADDIQYLLAIHQKTLREKQSVAETTQKAPQTAPAEISPLPGTSSSEQTSLEENTLSYLTLSLVFGLVIAMIFILWRERAYKILDNAV